MNPMDPKNDIFYLGVKALIVNLGGKLLVLQKNPKRLNQIEARWDIPGGRMQKNESLETALKREVSEETGLQNFIYMTAWIPSPLGLGGNAAPVL